MTTPDANNTDPPTWLEEAAKAAFRAVWEYGDGKVLALDRDDWRIAVRAAAPIIRRAADQETHQAFQAAHRRADDWRAERDRERGLRLLAEDWAAKHAKGEAEARARLADAERERDEALKSRDEWCAIADRYAASEIRERTRLTDALAELDNLRAQLADARRATLNEAADALLKHRIDLHDSWAGYRNSVRDGRLGGLEEAATLLRERAKGGSE